MKLVYVTEILENAKYANRDTGETDVLKTVQLIVKMGHVRKILGTASSVKEDFGEVNAMKTVQLIVKAGHVIKIMASVGSVKEGFGVANVLKIVQLIVKFVLMRMNVLIASMDGMVLIVKSRAQITAETVDLVTK